MQNARLADFTNGWSRHPQDEGIVFTRQRQIFQAAAHDLSCRAAILHIDDDKKAIDRTAFKTAWETSTHDKNHKIMLEHSPKNGLSFSYQNFVEEIGFMLGFDHGKVKAQLNEIIEYQRHAAQNQTDSMYIDIMKDWRLGPDEQHDPHSVKVINRVFCSNGTILPLSAAGEIQVPEGDCLFMREGCAHNPEWLTTENKNTERFTVAGYG